MLLKALKFVMRGAADKAVIPVLTHICVHDGRLQATDSRLAFEAECPELAEYSFTVPAEKFTKAIEICGNNPKITVLESKIRISKNRFRATLATLSSDEFPRVNLDEEPLERLEVGCEFLKTIKRVAPFISQDATRGWATGIWLQDGYAYATNNVVFVRAKIPWTFSPINLPQAAVTELLEIQDAPIAIRVGGRSFVADYPGGRWFRSALKSEAWSTTVVTMLDQVRTESLVPTPDGLGKSLADIIPFCPDPRQPVIYFREGGIMTTADGEHTAEMQIDQNFTGGYRAEVLKMVLGVARRWDPTTYPRPIYFQGNQLEGMFIGVRDAA